MSGRIPESTNGCRHALMEGNGSLYPWGNQRPSLSTLCRVERVVVEKELLLVIVESWL